MNVKSQRVLVVGLGRSGVAAALFLKERGARVTVSDAKAQAELSQHIPALLEAGVTVETGGHGERTFRDQDLIIVSPGVPSDSPPLQHARAQGVPVIGEVELASRFILGRMVAITGSNGKTTTTTLCGQILSAAGFHTLVGGNIGTPFISLVPQARPESWLVLEVSSFQLETIEQFRPDVAVILNISPDHLDRHRTLDAYVAAKARIFENQQSTDTLILNADDPTCMRLADRARSDSQWFSRRGEIKRGAYVQEQQIRFRRADGTALDIMPVSEIPLAGAHNVENVLAAVCVAVTAGCAPEVIRRAVSEFRAVEHRLELVATIEGVRYYNDSKATNVDATMKALEAFPGGIHLILGGKDKGSDYSVLNPLLAERVQRVYTIGAAAEKIESQIRGAEVTRSGTLEVAVQAAAEAAQSGDIVLLAPACASFDQFESYEHRGRIFKQTVAEVAARSAPAGGRG